MLFGAAPLIRLICALRHSTARFLPAEIALGNPLKVRTIRGHGQTRVRKKLALRKTILLEEDKNRDGLDPLEADTPKKLQRCKEIL